MADSNFFSPQGPFTLLELARAAAADIFYNGQEVARPSEELSFRDVAALHQAGPEEVSFLSNPKYYDNFASTAAGCIIIEAKHLNFAPGNKWLLVAKNSYAAYALIAALFYPAASSTGIISERACIDPSANIGKNVAIADCAVIGANVSIGDNSIIGANAVVGAGVQIGVGTNICAGVTVSHAIIGNSVMIHPGVRIGQDGFGFATVGGVHLKVPQLGRVVIGNNVEIGANTCIDRGTNNDTIIGDNCQIDNLVQIGHNVVLGKGCVLVSMTGVSGSTVFEEYVVAGGQSGFAGHLHISKGSQIAAQAGVISNLGPGAKVGGTPAVPISQWHRQSIILKKLVSKGNV